MHLFLHVSTSVTFKVLSICCNTLNIVAIFLNSPILMPFSAFAIFLFHLFHIGKTFPFEDFFHSEEQKKVTRGEIRWIGRMGHRVHAAFGQKLLNMQCVVGRCTCKSPIMKWANVLKEFSKKFTEAECSLSQQRQLVHWHRRVPRTLT